MAARKSKKNEWEKYVSPFAEAIGKKPEEVAEALESLVGEPGDDAIALLKNPKDTLDEEIISRFPAIPLAKVRKAVPLLREENVIEENAEAASGGTMSYDILPAVPDDESFLNSLKTGGVLKIGKTEVISAVRAALANKSGLYDIPNKLAKRMEDFANEQEEPCGENFYNIMKMVTRRNYAEVLSAINVETKYVSEARKNQLLGKIDTILWPALIGFNDQIKAWLEAWNQGANSGMALVSILAAQQGGGPPNMALQPPDTSSIRDAADGVVDKINKVFAGFGIPVSRALAWDANNIKNVLEDSSLPAQIGATNREQMLKSLGISVSSDYVRLECNLTRYILSVMSLEKVSAGQEEVNYLVALSQLGTSIPWSELGFSSQSSVRNGDPVSAKTY